MKYDIFCLPIIAICVVVNLQLAASAAVNHQPFVSEKNQCKADEYFDKTLNKCRAFSGGGNAIYVDHSLKCADGFIGVRHHPDGDKWYYLCNEDSVVVGECPNSMRFNSKAKKCEYSTEIASLPKNPCNLSRAPQCQRPGRFPIDENYSCFYICDKNGTQMNAKVFKCPGNSVYSPVIKKCCYTSRVKPTQIVSSNFSDNDAFPPCTKPGRFRTPTDCSKYYICSAKTNGKFYQTRHTCPSGFSYDMREEKCLPANTVECKMMNAAAILNLYEYYKQLEKPKCVKQNGCICNDSATPLPAHQLGHPSAPGQLSERDELENGSQPTKTEHCIDPVEQTVEVESVEPIQELIMPYVPSTTSSWTHTKPEAQAPTTVMVETVTGIKGSDVVRLMERGKYDSGLTTISISSANPTEPEIGSIHALTGAVPNSTVSFKDSVSSIETQKIPGLGSSHTYSTTTSEIKHEVNAAEHLTTLIPHRATVSADIHMSEPSSSHSDQAAHSTATASLAQLGVGATEHLTTLIPDRTTVSGSIHTSEPSSSRPDQTKEEKNKIAAHSIATTSQAQLGVGATGHLSTLIPDRTTVSASIHTSEHSSSRPDQTKEEKNKISAHSIATTSQAQLGVGATGHLSTLIPDRTTVSASIHTSEHSSSRSDQTKGKGEKIPIATHSSTTTSLAQLGMGVSEHLTTSIPSETTVSGSVRTSKPSPGGSDHTKWRETTTTSHTYSAAHQDERHKNTHGYTTTSSVEQSRPTEQPTTLIPIEHPTTLISDKTTSTHSTESGPSRSSRTKGEIVTITTTTTTTKGSAHAHSGTHQDDGYKHKQPGMGATEYPTTSIPDETTTSGNSYTTQPGLNFPPHTRGDTITITTHSTTKSSTNTAIKNEPSSERVHSGNHQDEIYQSKHAVSTEKVDHGMESFGSGSPHAHTSISSVKQTEPRVGGTEHSITSNPDKTATGGSSHTTVSNHPPNINGEKVTITTTTTATRFATSSAPAHSVHRKHKSKHGESLTDSEEEPVLGSPQESFEPETTTSINPQTVARATADVIVPEIGAQRTLSTIPAEGHTMPDMHSRIVPTTDAPIHIIATENEIPSTERARLESDSIHSSGATLFEGTTTTDAPKDGITSQGSSHAASIQSDEELELGSSHKSSTVPSDKQTKPATDSTIAPTTAVYITTEESTSTIPSTILAHKTKVEVTSITSEASGSDAGRGHNHIHRGGKDEPVEREEEFELGSMHKLAGPTEGSFHAATTITRDGVTTLIEGGTLSSKSTAPSSDSPKATTTPAATTLVKTEAKAVMRTEGEYGLASIHVAPVEEVTIPDDRTILIPARGQTKQDCSPLEMRINPNCDGPKTVYLKIQQPCKLVIDMLDVPKMKSVESQKTIDGTRDKRNTPFWKHMMPNFYP